MKKKENEEIKNINNGQTTVKIKNKKRDKKLCVENEERKENNNKKMRKKLFLFIFIPKIQNTQKENS